MIPPTGCDRVRQRIPASSCGRTPKAVGLGLALPIRLEPPDGRASPNLRKCQNPRRTGCAPPAAAETGRADDLRPDATDRRRARRRATATSRASPSPGRPGEVVEEDAVADARRV